MPEITKCEFCENSATLMKKVVVNPNLLQWLGCPNQSAIDTAKYRLCVFVDRGYLRMVDTDDSQCLDSGEKVKISFCPMCGRKLI